MTKPHITMRSRAVAGLVLAAAIAVAGLALAGPADAASVLNGPINLGTSATYGALAGSALTNTGPTTIVGDIGVSPGSSITGMGGVPGSNVGATNDNNAAALGAENDVTTAYNNAAGLTPTTSGEAQLAGLSLTPGVYSGGALSISDNGTLTLAGTSATSIWVFQAASSLTIGSATHIVITGGATACNVFWQVGSSATIGTSAQFEGTVLASQAITAKTGASITGRLLASTAAVTLDSNSIIVPSGCAAGGTPSNNTGPAITSGAPHASKVGVPYSFTIAASGTPTPSFAISAGVLPAGLSLDATTGVISGTPTVPGTFTISISASNGLGSDATAIYSIVTAAPVLASTGINPAPSIGLAMLLLVLGTVLIALRRGRQHPHN